MIRFDAAVAEFHWLLSHVVEVDEVLSLSGVEGLDRETTAQLLDTAGEFIGTAIAPLNEHSDRIGVRMQGGRVVTPAGWRDAYEAWRENGWPALGVPPSHGGQGMPFIMQACVATMLGGADLGFAMVAVSARGAGSVLLAHAEAGLAAICVPRLASGEWTATIAITEAQAGSDVGLISTKATRRPDGRFSLTGSKIFISGGDHDLTEQILHIVLARLEGAAPGVKGLSLFLVPSRLFTATGELQGRNALGVSSIEEKMGLHGSATCVLDFAGAEGVMIGAEGAGLATLFTMMHELRIEVALNAVGLSACATAHALAYAAERRQGRAHGGGMGPVPIAEHPDVQRMLLIMRTLTDGGRALVLEAARSFDLARLAPTPQARAEAKLRLEWLLPICKATLSENAVEVADIGIQIRGGHGYVRESGAEQFLRDVRVLPIYEGTNGIHAIDLVTRKLQRDGGRAYHLFIADIRKDLQKFADRADLSDIRGAVQRGVDLLSEVSSRLAAGGPDTGRGTLFGAKSYLDLAGRVAMAWMWLRMASAARPGADAMTREKRSLASFFASYYEPEFHLHAARVLNALTHSHQPEELHHGKP
ncbi:MAG: acyl-CoA dehydrogenase [Pseudomonadota bacterium]|nr:acyl-CoA dehydrogenase [Pseudomonadota bacterium]